LFRDGAEQLGQKPETFESLADGYLLMIGLEGRRAP
jgi:hypothetical protein